MVILACHARVAVTAAANLFAQQGVARLSDSNIYMNLHTYIQTYDWLYRHIPGPEGVRGRNSDNALILKQLGWEPTVKLADGLKMTYDWIKDQLTSEKDHSAYSKSTIVQTSAPRELGSLREADGKEGFDKAKQAAREGFEAAGVTVNGHTNVQAAS